MSSLASALPEPLVKPRLRGVSHQIACGVALVAGAVLVSYAPTDLSRGAAAVYAICLASLLGISAAYHRPTWKPRARAWMRRLDHAAIFLLIAGTYTPVSLALSARDGATLRAVAWGGAIAGVVQSLVWVTAPKPLIAAICVVLGWSIVPYIGRMHASVGALPLGLLLAGGVVCSLGALVYAKKRPDPSPAVFGYHEVFHALVIAAAVLHFASVTLVVLRR